MSADLTPHFLSAGLGYIRRSCAHSCPRCPYSASCADIRNSDAWITPPFINRQAAFPCQKPDKTGYTHFRRYLHKHMHVIGASFRFDDRDALSTAAPEYFSDFIAFLAIKHFAAMFSRRPFHVVCDNVFRSFIVLLLSSFCDCQTAV